MKYKGIILGTKVTRPTARLIAEKFNAFYTEMPGIFSSHVPGIEYIFRYGNANVQVPENFAGNCVLFNPIRAVRLMSNKIECRKHLLTWDIRCPNMYNKRDFFSSDLLRAIPYPIIARPPHHSQGRNFNVIQSETEAKKFLDIGYYLQEIIHKRIEYRMFMFNELIMEANEKVKIGEYADELIRNHRRGWAFKKRLLESIPRSTRTLCTNAATRVHSNWCAIDVCENQDGTPYILEMNSAPGLIERKVDKLAEKFFSTFPNFIVSSSGYENDGPDAMYER